MNNIIVFSSTFALAFVATSCGSKAEKNEAISEESAAAAQKPRTKAAVCQRIEGFFKQYTTKCCTAITPNGECLAGLGTFQGVYYQCQDPQKTRHVEYATFLSCSTGSPHRW